MSTIKQQCDVSADWSLPLIIDPNQKGAAYLDSLISGTRGVLVLREFLSDKAVSAALKSVKDVANLSKFNRYGNTTLHTIGPYLAGRIQDSDSYFADADKILGAYGPGLAELATTVYAVVRETLGLKELTTASDQFGRKYSSFMLLMHKNVGMPLHNDMISRDAKKTDLAVANVNSQLRCVVCLQECTHGGELILYRRKWYPRDESEKVQGNFGYPSSIVSDSEKLVFKPEVGDIYIFNSTQYHEVAETSGETRITLGFFLGQLGPDKEKMVTWS